jgi:hypothetical protein
MLKFKKQLNLWTIVHFIIPIVLIKFLIDINIFADNVKTELPRIIVIYLVLSWEVCNFIFSKIVDMFGDIISDDYKILFSIFNSRGTSWLNVIVGILGVYTYLLYYNKYIEIIYISHYDLIYCAVIFIIALIFFNKSKW